MNIKRNIIFALEARKKNGVAITENVPIRMRVNYSGQRIEFTMPYRIDAAKWDATKQRVKNGCTNKLKVSASEINAELTRSYTLIQDIFKLGVQQVGHLLLHHHEIAEIERVKGQERLGEDTALKIQLLVLLQDISALEIVLSPALFA